MEALNFEDVISELGEFGRYQIFMYLLACIPAFFTGAQVVTPTFTAYEPPHRCRVTGCDLAGGAAEYEADNSWLDVTTPYDNEGDIYSECQLYKHDVIQAINETIGIDSCDVTRLSTETYDCSSWVYDKTEFTATSITDFDLVCDSDWLQPLISSLYMIGLCFGAPFWGWFSDRFGRLSAMIWATFGAGVVCVITGVLPEYVSFAVFKFLGGFFNIGVFQGSFLIGLEYVGLRIRMVCGICIEFFFAAGEASVALFAYLIDDWRILQIVMSAPMCLAVVYYWLIPESARWLLAKGKWEKAKKIILKAAKINKVQLSERVIPNEKTVLAETKTVEELSMWIAVKDMAILRMTIIMTFCWLTSAMAYYALSLNSSNLTGDIYLNFALLMLIEMPGYVLALITLDRFGRRLSMSFYFLLAGICCIIAGFIPEDINWLIITLSLLGKMGVSATFATVYVYTAELFPTVIRSSAIGTCSGISRIGSVLSPFIADLGEVNEAIPFLICGVFSFVAGVGTLDLPETNGAVMPETLEDAKELKRKTGGFFSLKRRLSQSEKSETT